MKSRLLTTLIFSLAAISLYAESAKETLEEIFKLYYQDREYEARQRLDGIPESSLSSENDTIKFQYYYIKASLLDVLAGDGDTQLKTVAEQRALIDKALEILETRLDVHNAQYMELMAQKANYYNLLDGDIDKAILTYEKALVVGSYPRGVGMEAVDYWYGIIFWQLANLYEQKGYEKQLVALYKSVADVMPSDGDVPPYIGYILLGTYYERHGKYMEAADASRQALDIIEKREGKGLNYVQTLKSIGTNQINAGMNREALDTFRKAIELAESDAACANELLVLRYGCAEACIGLEEYSAAKEYSNCLLDHQETLPGDVVALALHQRSVIEEALGEDGVAMSLSLQASIEAEKNKDSIPRADMLAIYLRLADFHNALGQFDDCLRDLSIAIDYTDDPKMTNYIVGQMASCNISKEDYEEARWVYNAYLTELLDPSETDLVADTHNKQAVVELLDNKPEEAHRLLELSWSPYKDAPEKYGEQHFYYLHNKGRAYMLQGKNEEALECLKESREIQIRLNGEVMDNTLRYIEELDGK